ncbi:hypothetical protein ACRQEC_09050 [Actinotignum sp. GS-2025c]|uniref:hypothetical protein n=1 Tax=Actinotignum sp. GS-2025c TaxID=3427276 RepID=UPI003F467947
MGNQHPVLAEHSELSRVIDEVADDLIATMKEWDGLINQEPPFVEDLAGQCLMVSFQAAKHAEILHICLINLAHALTCGCEQVFNSPYLGDAIEVALAKVASGASTQADADLLRAALTNTLKERTQA